MRKKKAEGQKGRMRGLREYVEKEGGAEGENEV